MKFASLSLVALLAMASAQETQLKVASVDMQTLFKNFYRTAEMQTENAGYTSTVAKENEDRVKKFKELQTASEALRKQIEDPSTPDSKKQAIFAEWQAKQQQGMALDRERTEFLRRKNAAMNDHVGEQVKTIYSEIQKIVDTYAKAQNYDLVFDKSSVSANSMGLIPITIYTKDATDITEVLLKDLNKNAPKGAELPKIPEGAGDK